VCTRDRVDDGPMAQLMFAREQELANQPMHRSEEVTPWARELDKIHHWMRSESYREPDAAFAATFPATGDTCRFVQGWQEVHEVAGERERAATIASHPKLGGRLMQEARPKDLNDQLARNGLAAWAKKERMKAMIQAGLSPSAIESVLGGTNASASR